MSDLRRTDLVRITGRKEAGDHIYVVSKVHDDDFTRIRRISVHPMSPRLFTGRDVVPHGLDGLLPEEVQRLSTPAEALADALSLRQEAWPTRTRNSIERLFALWLLHEDRKRLLDAANVDQLAHQVSLLEYVKQKDLRRLLIADEVGLGKTIEAGMLIQWVLDASPAARILYLAPAMLVDNVHGELKRMGTAARIDRYAAALSTVRNDALKDAQVVVASIHKAAFEGNRAFWEDASGAWDLIIVDECHHISDWSQDGSSPMQQMRLVRALIEKRLKPGGRLVLMSATPHQGNEQKFRNLLRLLADDMKSDTSGSLESVAGRVVYRTKEDVRDWDNRPLFSKRKVNEPTSVELGPDYHGWLDSIETLFSDAGPGPAAWRKAQALQWAASSPKAGLAYLTRLALRGGLDFDTSSLLRDAAAALRPYRGLPADAPVEAVQNLLRKQVEKTASEEEEDDYSRIADPLDPRKLTDALNRGLQLMKSAAMHTKLSPLLKWLEDEKPAKFVVFASPIETVDELKLGLERVLGAGAVVAITGTMKPHERLAQMHAFRGERVRALVASKAGSEGINLQVSHRLVHFDVPWNPMEMEQRVGRVHRYGSTRTIVVDTLVVKNSREERMLNRCRARLAQIIGDLFGSHDSEKFNDMYTRVMTQISAEELAALMAAEGFGEREDPRLNELVKTGFDGWQASDQALRQGSTASTRQIPDRGETRDTDLEDLFHLLDAKQETGWNHVRLVEHDGKRREETTPARVWSFPTEGKTVCRVADRLSSLSVRGPSGFQGSVERAGLNLPDIAAKVRELVGGGRPDVGRSPHAVGFIDGAGAARVSDAEWNGWVRGSSRSENEWRNGAVLLTWTVRLLHRGTRTETWSGVAAWLAKPDLSGGSWLTNNASAEMFRLLWRGRRRQNLQLPPHQRADNAGFKLTGLREEAARRTSEVLRQIEAFDDRAHDYEIVPIAALTIEPRRDAAPSETDDSDSAQDSLDFVNGQLRPSPSFVETLLGLLADTPTGRSPGPYSLDVVLFAEPGLLASADPELRSRAFGAYIGVVEDSASPTERKSQRHTLSGAGIVTVGIARLDARYRGMSRELANVVRTTIMEKLESAGLRVFQTS